MRSILIAIVALFLSCELTGQVIFSKDIFIDKQQRKAEKGLSQIVINLVDRPSWNPFTFNRNRCLIIDFRALRERGRSYTFTEIAERVYVPANVMELKVHRVPDFLLLPPPSVANKHFVFRSGAKPDFHSF